MNLPTFKKLTREDYLAAIQAATDGMTQLENDGGCCVVCGSDSHLAWQCPHNATAMHLFATQVMHADWWKCYHCDVILIGEDAAKDHFGHFMQDNANCVIDKDWKPDADNINRLPQPLRKYIRDVETLCDPSFIIQENHRLELENLSLRAAIEIKTNPEPVYCSCAIKNRLFNWSGRCINCGLPNQHTSESI